MSTKYFIQADKQTNGNYSPTEISQDLDRLLYNYEYGDVVKQEYQIWEYPSGKISHVVSDRKVDDDNYYAGPSEKIWLPKLDQFKVDVEKVAEAYKTMSRP